MYRYKILFLLFFSLFTLSILKAQETNTIIYGKTVDIHSKVIEGVNILIKHNDKIIKYLNTNSSGSYKVSLNLPDSVKSITIEAKLLGYKAEAVVLQLSNKIITTDFILIDQLMELNEVNIKKEKASIIVKGDTTSFSLKGFRQGNERTLEDIIKKLPGMSVDDNGNISFKGNRIEKVLLDNEDFYKEKYKNLTQNFNQINIDTIEAIENYLEEDILSGFFKSGKTVLNLKLTKSNGTHASGNVDVGLGSDTRYDASSNAVVWRNKVKFMNILSLNNVSKGIISHIPEINTYNKLNYVIQPVNSSNIFPPISTINSNLKGNIFVLNPNFVIRPFQKISIKGSGGYYIQDEKSNLNSNLNYYEKNSFLDQNSLSSNMTKDKSRDYELELKYAIDKVSRIKSTISNTRQRNRVFQMEDLNQLLYSSINDYSPLSIYDKIATSIDYLRKHNSTTIFNLASSFYALNIDNNTSNIFTKTNSNVTNQLSYNENYISDSYLRVYKKNNSLFTVYGVGMSYNHENMNSHHLCSKNIPKSEVSMP